MEPFFFVNLLALAQCATASLSVSFPGKQISTETIID